jgi:anti-sigma B factor antagonist
MPRRFTVERTEALHGRITIAFAGELDMAGVAAARMELRRAEAGGHEVVLDLRRLEFMDSCGLRVLLEADRRLRMAGACLMVVRGPRAVERVLEITGMDARLELVDDPASLPPPGTSVGPGASAELPSLSAPVAPGFA